MCDSSPGRTLYRCRFEDQPIRDYLLGFYPGFDDADFAMLAGGELVIEECAHCACVWQRFAPGDELLTTLYESWAAGDGGLERHDDLAYHRAAAEEVLLALGLAGRRPSEVSVLDFGMGWGRWPRLAAAFGMRAYGVELSATQAAYADTQGVTVLALDELPDETFHFINTEQVFEHLVEPRQTLQRLARSLAPGGWIKIAVPDGTGMARAAAETRLEQQIAESRRPARAPERLWRPGARRARKPRGTSSSHTARRSGLRLDDRAVAAEESRPGSCAPARSALRSRGDFLPRCLVTTRRPRAAIREPPRRPWAAA